MYICICVQDIQQRQQPHAQGMMEYAVVDKKKKKVDRQQNVSQ